MEIRPITTGVREVAQNSRLVLILTFILVIFEQVLLTAGMSAAFSDWPVKLSMASLVLGSFAGVNVLLKQPFGEERQSNLNESVHKGLNLFYGAQLGGFIVGLIILSASFVFGDFGGPRILVH